MTEQGERVAEGVCEDEVGRQEFHAVVGELEDDRVGGRGAGGLGDFSEKRLKEGCFSIFILEKPVCQGLVRGGHMVRTKSVSRC